MTACRMHEFNQSLSYDRRMHAADIKGSIAYAKALVLGGVLTKEEGERMVEGLTKVGEEWKTGKVSGIVVLLSSFFADNKNN